MDNEAYGLSHCPLLNVQYIVYKKALGTRYQYQSATTEQLGSKKLQ